MYCDVRGMVHVKDPMLIDRQECVPMIGMYYDSFI